MWKIDFPDMKPFLRILLPAAVCGLLLAAFSLGHPRDVPETSRDSAPWPVVRVVPAWNGFQAERNVY